jgi:uncharacterized protein with PQ loop repeat
MQSIPNIFGILSTLILGFAGVPQVWLVIKNRNAKGISLISLLMNVLGLSLLCLYVYLKHGFDLWLHIEYLFALLLSLIILWYKIYE